MSAPEDHTASLEEQWEQMCRGAAELAVAATKFREALAEAFRKVDWAALHAALEKLSLQAEEHLKTLERGDDVL